jgi:penicillin-binding protein 2
MWHSGPRELSDKVFSRRAFILLVGKFLIVTAIIIRLLFLQIFKAKAYKTLSDKNRIKFIIINPRRGVIKDTNGKLLAHNKEIYKVYFYKQKGESYETILEPVFDVLGCSPKNRLSLLKLVKKASYLQPIVIKDNVNWKTVVKIEAETYRLPGVSVEKSFVRYYPWKAKLAHVLGYTGLPNKKEIAAYKLQYARKAKIGKNGVERHLNHSLIGKFGAKKVEVNANRIIVRDLLVEPSCPGNDINLTINIDLQNLLYNLLPKSNSAAAVIEVATGNILAICSLPSFNPNLFSTEFDEVEWNSVLQNKHSPFTNKVIGKAYPPGSTWKIITSLAILESGIDPRETVFCNGFIQVGNRKFKCWKRAGHGNVDFYNAMPFSCNCYFYKMGIKVGIERIYRVARALGFGQKIGIELSGEAQGINPNKLWKANYSHGSWTHGDTANSSIGQGFVLTTPFQLMTMISRVASGKIISPSLLKGHQKNFSAMDLPFKKENLEIVRGSLVNAINSHRGTAFSARIREKQFLMAGKTGTAQVVSRDTATEKGASRSHSIFVGYAPINDPRYATVVVADNAGWGSATAAPIGRDILLFAQKNA